MRLACSEQKSRKANIKGNRASLPVLGMRQCSLACVLRKRKRSSTIKLIWPAFLVICDAN